MPTLRLDTPLCRVALSTGKIPNRGTVLLVSLMRESNTVHFKDVMRRHGVLWPRITDMENIRLAFHKAALRKSSHQNVQKQLKNLEPNLEKLRESLINKTFTTSRYFEKKVYEPKERIIYVVPFYPDRIVQHALMNIISPIWDKIFIYDSYACRIGKGGHRGSTRTMEFVRQNKYVLKCDIRKFYPSVDQDILMRIIKQKIKCPDTLCLIENIVRSFPGGKNVPIGNYTSQWFGNLYLNEIDQYVKTELQKQYGHIDYIRYCDDFCLFNNNKSILNECREKIREYLDTKLKLQFSKSDVFPVRQGVDYLGYRHFDNYVLLRKSTTKRVRKRMALLPVLYEKNKITAEQYRSSVASTYGWLKHANTHNLQVRMELKELMEKAGELQ
jgi:retron-type reverse transcriptase